MSKSREEVDRTAWATIDQLPQSPVERAGLAKSGRPKSFPELEKQLQMGIDFDCALSMFLHEFYQHRDPSFFAEPPSQQLSDINAPPLLEPPSGYVTVLAMTCPRGQKNQITFLKVSGTGLRIGIRPIRRVSFSKRCSIRNLL
jgi:hypothetical protein